MTDNPAKNESKDGPMIPMVKVKAATDKLVSKSVKPVRHK